MTDIYRYDLWISSEGYWREEPDDRGNWYKADEVDAELVSLRARVAELEAALEHIGTCGRDKMPHYCPNCSRSFSWEPSS